MTDSEQLVVTDDPARSRFEARLGGALAGFAEYNRDSHSIDFVHTEVDRAFEGKGVGSGLISGALDAVRAEGGLTVFATCPFVKRYLERHPEYRDLTR